MEYCSRPDIRDQTVNVQAAYTNLLTAIQSLVYRAEQSMSDHTLFNKAKEEFTEWYNIAMGTVQDSSNPAGSAEDVKQRTELIKNVAARMTEGQHLLNCATENFNKVIHGLDDAQQNELREDLTKLKKDFDSLNLLINDEMSTMKAAVNRWAVYNETIEDVKTWISDVENNSQVKYF